MRQEREKRIEAEARRKVVEEAKSNAAYLMKLVAQEKEAKAQQQREREAEKREEERRQREKEEAERWEEEKRQREKEAERLEEERRQRELEAQRRVEETRQKHHADHTQAQNDDVIVLDQVEVVEELDVGSNLEVFALPRTSRQANTSEGMYSPDLSVVGQGSPSSALKKSTRLIPSRWVVLL